MRKFFLSLVAFVLVAAQALALDWRAQYSDGVNLKKAPGIEFYFDIPQGDGHVNYIVARYDKPVVIGQKMKVQWRLRRISGKPVVESLDRNSGLAPNFRPMICDDPLQYRWWSNPACVFFNQLPATGKTKVVEGTLIVPVRPPNWSNVNGKQGDTVKADFVRDMKNIHFIALTFGGGRSFGHGLKSEGGVIRVEVISVRVE